MPANRLVEISRIMLPFSDYSIPKKLTWMNMLVSGTALALACGLFITFDLISIRDAMVRNLSIQAKIVGSNSVSALLFNDPKSAERTLAALSSAPNVLSAGIYGSDGQLFAAYRRGDAPPFKLRTPNSGTMVRWIGDKGMMLASPILLHGQVKGTVYIWSDLSELTDGLRRYLLILGLVLLTSLLAAATMSSIFRRAIADPILKLAQTARVVSREKTYSIRAPGTSNRDELSDLIGTFNEMLRQIEERDTALLAIHENLEQRVTQRTAQLDAANKELEAFSYSVAHDLRAPLRHINGFSKILREDYSATMDSTAQHYLKLIQDGANNMGQLVDDLLKMGRIGRQELFCQDTDLNRLVEGVIQDLQSECKDRRIEWRVSDLPSIECDAGLMKQVFANLLSNAVKYTRNSANPVIEVGQTRRDGETAFFVRDNGAGFDQKYAHKLFGVFQRLHHADEFEGTGVGLATVQRIIQKHGGRIWAEAEVDKGAAFFFVLEAGSSRCSGTAAKSAAAGES